MSKEMSQTDADKLAEFIKNISSPRDAGIFIVLDEDSIEDILNKKRNRRNDKTFYNNKSIFIMGENLDKAKAKHPKFPENPAEALSIITEELGELAQAINDKDCTERQIEEAAHVAVTAIQFIEGQVK